MQATVPHEEKMHIMDSDSAPPLPAPPLQGSPHIPGRHGRMLSLCSSGNLSHPPLFCNPSPQPKWDKRSCSVQMMARPRGRGRGWGWSLESMLNVCREMLETGSQGQRPRTADPHFTGSPVLLILLSWMSSRICCYCLAMW